MHVSFSAASRTAAGASVERRISDFEGDRRDEPPIRRRAVPSENEAQREPEGDLLERAIQPDVGATSHLVRVGHEPAMRRVTRCPGRGRSGWS